MVVGLLVPEPHGSVGKFRPSGHAGGTRIVIFYKSHLISVIRLKRGIELNTRAEEKYTADDDDDTHAHTTLPSPLTLSLQVETHFPQSLT